MGRGWLFWCLLKSTLRLICSSALYIHFVTCLRNQNTSLQRNACNFLFIYCHFRLQQQLPQVWQIYSVLITFFLQGLLVQYLWCSVPCSKLTKQAGAASTYEATCFQRGCGKMHREWTWEHFSPYEVTSGWEYDLYTVRLKRQKAARVLCLSPCTGSNSPQHWTCLLRMMV